MKKIVWVAFFILISGFCRAAKVDTLDIASLVMNKTYKAAVVLPNSYAKGTTRYPVIYLLHGAYGHFRDWLKKIPDANAVKDIADRYNLIIVMPEGETFSFYIDSPVNKDSQFDTYITSEVISKIDKTYRTVADKKGRAISGLSMGGHGALYLSAKHPDLFAAAGSMSGAVDMAGIPDDSTNRKMAPIFGTQGVSPEVLASYSVMNMIDKLKANKLPLIIDCGVSDFLIESNRELHRRLVYYQVPHDYTERPGTHTWEYWENSLSYHVLFFSKIFKSNGVLVK